MLCGLPIWYRRVNVYMRTVTCEHRPIVPSLVARWSSLRCYYWGGEQISSMLGRVLRECSALPQVTLWVPIGAMSS